MRVRLAPAISAIFVSLLVLTGCSPLGTSSGADALAHLNTAVDASVAKFDNDGGTETIVFGDYHNLLIYNPDAPKGERLVSVKLNDDSLPLFTSEEAISIRALAGILQNPLITGAEITEISGRYRIVGEKFVIEVLVTDGLVTQSAVVGAAFGSTDPQSVVTTYGLTDDAKLLFATAVYPPAK